MRWYPLLFSTALVLSSGAWKAAAAGKAEHVVLVVWDGLRPDFVTPQYTPTLYDLAQRGTFFARHHAAYVSTTEVNGTALATGMHPEHSGIIANTEYRPDLNWLSSYGTEALDVVRRGDAASQGHYLQAETVAEMLHEAGFPTIIAAAKPIGLLHDRASKRVSQSEKDSVTLFRGLAIPRRVQESLAKSKEVGPFPGAEAGENSDSGLPATRPKKSALAASLAASTNAAATPSPTAGAAYANSVDAWTTKALVRGLWKTSVPKYSVLWLSEPDAAQHAAGVGSEAAVSALESSDDQLAAVIKTLEEKDALDTTDIFVVSDHGFSTINRGPDIIDSLKKSHLTAFKQFQNPETGDILVDTLGGTAFFYVFNHDEEVIKRLVTYLQGTDFGGVVFSSIPVEGAFRFEDAHLAASNGVPDVAVSMRWTGDKNEYGAPGLMPVIEGKLGSGSHGSLSPFDLHNTLIAAGPDIKKGFVDQIPSGNIDVAPTILSILGVTPKAALDGRVLAESLASSTSEISKPVEKLVEARRDLGFRSWHQYLKVVSVGNAVYFDEGNGDAALK